MSAEPRRATNAEAWTQWENRVVNGAFPLRRILGHSNDSAVFLTEYKSNNLADAAIKIVRVDAAQAKALLAQWESAIARSHPHLVRLFEVGRCQSDGREFVFVVMEYAEQTLAQILKRRALAPEEVSEMLLPTLEALAFLHRNLRVHGRLKPANILAVDEQLKLASDNIRRAGDSVIGVARASSYDPPELPASGISAVGDIWSLGMTLVEALTQRTRAWPDQKGETAPLPASVPVPLADTVRRCLSPTPADRPTVIDLRNQYKPATQTTSPPNPQPSVSIQETPQAAAIPPENSPKRNLLLPAIAVALLISLAVWVGMRSPAPPQAQLRPPVVSVPSAVAPSPVAPSPVAPSAVAKPSQSNSKRTEPVSRPPERSSFPTVATSPPVLHQVTPDVPQAIREKIQGRVHVMVRVLVDPSGNVVGALLEDPGPSKYFARLADAAAREWQFVPTEDQGTRVWLVRFEFTRNGVSTRLTAQ